MIKESMDKVKNEGILYILAKKYRVSVEIAQQSLYDIRNVYPESITLENIRKIQQNNLVICKRHIDEASEWLSELEKFLTSEKKRC